MIEKIIQLITFVMSNLQGNKKIENIDVNELLKLGYSHVEISTALSWIADKTDFDQCEDFINIDNHTKSIRLLHDSEKELFTFEAYEELIKLYSLKIIDNVTIENLIDKAMFSRNQKIDLITLRQLIAGMIYFMTNNNDSNKRVMLFGNESIN